MMAPKYLMCIPTIILWGLNPILTRLCSDIVGIRPYMMVTSIVACMATIAINSIMDYKVWSGIKSEYFTPHSDIAKRWIITGVDSIFCLALPMVFYNIMLSDTASIAMIVTTTWYGAPLVTCVLGVFVFSQSISPLQICGIIVCIGGIIMMNIEDIITEFKTRSYYKI